MTTTTRTATYKGRTYRLEFLGDTKFGRRAKLAFLDGSKNFWVDASLVTEGGAAVRTGYQVRTGGSGCAECGKGGRLVRDLEDGLLKHYSCCDIPPGGY